MNRREMMKRTALTGGSLALLGPSVLVQTGCGSTKQLAAWSGTVIAALRDVSPILTEMGASGIVNTIARAIPIAERLKKAFQDNDNTQAFQFLDDLINPQTGVIVDIATQIGALADDNRKRIVLGLLAIGQVALRLISAQIETDVPVATATAVSKARPTAAKAVKSAAGQQALEAAFHATRF